MNKESKETLYKCLLYLLNGLNEDCLDVNVNDNYFKELLDALPNNDNIEFEYNFIYVYMITILLNNHSFFNNKISKLPWNMPFHTFDDYSTINGHLAIDYGLKEGLTDEEIDEYEKSEVLNDPSYSIEYQDYLEKKYKDSMYEPDVQESIIFGEKYNFDHDIDYNPDEYSNDYYNNMLEEVYNEALATLPAMLKNKDKPNFSRIVQCIRNALAHNHFSITDGGLSMFSKDSFTGEKNFECVISNANLLEIIEKYISMILEEDIIQTPTIMYLFFNDIKTMPIEDDYIELKNNLYKEFKSLNLENEFIKIMENVEKNINDNRSEYLIDYDKEEDITEEEYLNYDRKRVLIELVKEYFLKNNEVISNECKIFELLFIIENFNHQLYENWYGVYSSFDYDSSKVLSFDNLEYEIKHKYPWIYDIYVSMESKSFLSKIVLLLNLLFVQCPYDNVDKEVIDLSMMTIDPEYINEKNKIFAPQIEKIKAKCEKAMERIDQLTDTINSGKTSIEKQDLLVAMQNDLNRMKDNIDKLKSDWKSAVSFDNSSIIKHIRNSFAHGSYTIQIPEDKMDLKSFNIVIKDYEIKTNKITFSGTISLYDLLTNVLKPEIINKLFDLDNKTK